MVVTIFLSMSFSPVVVVVVKHTVQLKVLSSHELPSGIDFLWLKSIAICKCIGHANY